MILTIIMLSMFSCIFADSAVDTTLVKTSARSIALGNAFAPQADDYSALFSNPAGLIKVRNLEIGAMQNTILDTISNFNGVAVVPVANGTFAFGTVFSGASGMQTTAKDINDRMISTGSLDYSNLMLVGAFASKVQSPFSKEDNLAIGISGKIFSESVGGSLSYKSLGFNSDFGLLYTVNPAFDLSAVYHNFLPTTIKWDTNYTSNIDYSMNAGFKYSILSNKEGSLFSLENQTLDLLTDVELFNQNNKMTPHFGLEYKPFSFLAIRAGMSIVDQAVDSVSVGKVNKYALGLGVYYEGFRFDYAYSIDPDGIENNNAHFFSMMVDILPAPVSSVVKPAAQKEAPQYVKLDFTSDRFTTYKKRQVVVGSVVAQVSKIKVNEDFVEIANGKFKKQVKFSDYGKHVIRVVAYDDMGNVLSTLDSKVLYLYSFPDVSEKNWARKYIEELATAKLIKGFPDGNFKPNDLIKRGEFSTLLVRTKNLPYSDERATNNAVFTDIKNHWASPFILKVSQEGLMKGYAGRKFMPDKPTVREEAVFSMVKMDELVVPVATTKSNFKDVRSGTELNKYVEASVENGLIVGYPDGTFRPLKDITRAEIAKVFYTSKLGQAYINEMYDWPSYKYNPADYK